MYPSSNSAIKYPVTVGASVTSPAVIAIRDISFVIEEIKKGSWESQDMRPQFELIRQSGIDEALAQTLKKKLPWFCGSVCERRRANDSVLLAHFLVFDLDHVADIEAVKKAAIAKLPFIRYAFRSVRDGVKLIAQLKSPVTKEEDFRRLWAYLSLQLEKALGLKVDATPDWSRACFMSWDPELLSNPHCQAIDVAVALEQAELVHLMMNRSKDEQIKREPPLCSTVQPFICSTDSDYEKARSIVLRLAQKRIDYRDWVRIGYALYSAFGDAGKPIWDLFLSNPYYEDTAFSLARHWHSFAKVHSTTINTLFYLGGKYGCE